MKKRMVGLLFMLSMAVRIAVRIWNTWHFCAVFVLFTLSCVNREITLIVVVIILEAIFIQQFDVDLVDNDYCEIEHKSYVIYHLLVSFPDSRFVHVQLGFILLLTSLGIISFSLSLSISLLPAHERMQRSH